LWLEVGFGSGEHLVEQARRRPDIGFIGCEVFVNGVAALVGQVERLELANVRVFDDDARLLLTALPEASISRSFLLFPDPWPKDASCQAEVHRSRQSRDNCPHSRRRTPNSESPRMMSGMSAGLSST
jgi:hypothetical protein